MLLCRGKKKKKKIHLHTIFASFKEFGAESGQCISRELFKRKTSLPAAGIQVVPDLSMPQLQDQWESLGCTGGQEHSFGSLCQNSCDIVLLWEVWNNSRSVHVYHFSKTPLLNSSITKLKYLIFLARYTITSYRCLEFSPCKVWRRFLPSQLPVQQNLGSAFHTLKTTELFKWLGKPHLSTSNEVLATDIMLAWYNWCCFPPRRSRDMCSKCHWGHQKS